MRLLEAFSTGECNLQEVRRVKQCSKLQLSNFAQRLLPSHLQQLPRDRV